MRKPLFSLLILILLTALLSPVLAETARKNEETGFEAVIDDAAGLLSAGETGEVLDAMIPVTGYANTGFVTREAFGSDSSSVLGKAERWGDSRFGRGSAYTVFIIDMQTRRLGIYSSARVYSLLSTAKANTITDNVYEYARNGDYAACAKEAFREIALVMNG